MKIYLDSCCYGRPFDDKNIPQTKAEADALAGIVKICKASGIKIIGSDAVTFELSKISNSEMQAKIEAYYKRTIDNSILMVDDDKTRATYLQTHGIGVMDSYHLTIAERGYVDFLITTDTKFLNRVEKNNLSIVQIKKPIEFLSEVSEWLQ